MQELSLKETFDLEIAGLNRSIKARKNHNIDYTIPHQWDKAFKLASLS